MQKLYLVVRHNSVIAGIHEIESSAIAIGRSTECDLQLPDAFVSRTHASISVTESSFRIRDLRSENGVYVNGLRISRETPLREGDEIYIKPYLISVYLDLASVIKNCVNADESTVANDSNSDSRREISSFLAQNLTPAQNRVCELLARGFIEKEVATQLGLSVHTVHEHTKAIYKALSVSTRGELVSRWLTQPPQSNLGSNDAGK